MSENYSRPGAHACHSRPPTRGVCDSWLVGLVFLTLVRTGEALAAEQVSFPGPALKADFDPPAPHGVALTPSIAPVGAAASFGGSSLASLTSLPTTYQSTDLQDGTPYSTLDFRPRGHSILDKEPQANAVEDAPMIRGTVWQRLSEYRAHGRVRLLTLWETGGSSLSLQAGKKGEPSLQWTSRSMNRGGATRGLLDQFVSSSLAGAGKHLSFTPRVAAAEPGGKPAKLLETGGGTLK